MIWITMLEIIGAAQEARESPDSVAEEPERADPGPVLEALRRALKRLLWRRMFGE
jgi:hypothetical protein